MSPLNTQRRRGLSAALLAGALLVLPAQAPAAPRPKALWATVNICDTLRHPDMMGVRASMPGNGRHQRMYMRFRAQYYNRPKKSFVNVGGSGVSRWVYAGSALFRTREAGYTFTFNAPAPGAGYVLRGVVDFQWRAKRRRNGHVRQVVLRRATANTKRGFRSTTGADPPGYSSGTCEIR